MTGHEIRQRFLDFFHDRGHRIVRSSSLVPANDPTLLFTNAGMNQFKDVFLLGMEKRDYQRAASSQKCVRAGGKHNDLENVGYTRRHHTFFEMLGNFSFGGYFKAEAIDFAWTLLTQEYGMPKDKLYITVFREDDEAEQLWQKVAGVPKDRIFRLDEKDNFWQMGETGPCGPCSEIHYDLGPEAADPGRENELFPSDAGGRYVEIWNLVFMQFNKDVGGALSRLPRPSIDTGMGLERVAAVLQGKLSNYDSDLIYPIIEKAADLFHTTLGVDPKIDTALRINADHARATTFLIHDGVLPANDGRGYVLRKIMRRAMRHARMAGVDRVFEIGGAQAISALAYGTATVPRVDKIVGPGNAYVAAAKRIVFGDVDIDAIAGPTEVLIVADDSADPAFVAADLLAQAEHDADAAPVLVTTSADLARRVALEISAQISALARRAIAEKSLASHGAIIVTGGLDEALRLADRYAPEHLGLHIRDAARHSDRIRNAGAIFVGHHTPEAAGDYYAGPNHVLPTGGAARYASPLGVYDFVKRISVLEYSPEALRSHADDIIALAEVEGLTAHARSVAIRTRQ